MPSLLAEDLLCALNCPRELELEDVLSHLTYQEGIDLGRLIRTYYLRSDGTEFPSAVELEQSLESMTGADRGRLAEIEMHFDEIVDKFETSSSRFLM